MYLYTNIDSSTPQQTHTQPMSVKVDIKQTPKNMLLLFLQVLACSCLCVVYREKFSKVNIRTAASCLLAFVRHHIKCSDILMPCHKWVGCFYSLLLVYTLGYIHVCEY